MFIGSKFERRQYFQTAGATARDAKFTYKRVKSKQVDHKRKRCMHDYRHVSTKEPSSEPELWDHTSAIGALMVNREIKLGQKNYSDCTVRGAEHLEGRQQAPQTWRPSAIGQVNTAISILKSPSQESLLRCVQGRSLLRNVQNRKEW